MPPEVGKHSSRKVLSFEVFAVLFASDAGHLRVHLACGAISAERSAEEKNVLFRTAVAK